jgi:hypothetical protein
MAVLIQEQRLKISQLEEMLPKYGSKVEGGIITEGILQSNDFFALKEEYCTKIETLVESHAGEL